MLALPLPLLLLRLLVLVIEATVQTCYRGSQQPGGLIEGLFVSVILQDEKAWFGLGAVLATAAKTGRLVLIARLPASQHMRGLRGNVWRLEFRVSKVIVLIRRGDPARSIQHDFGTSAERSASIFPQVPRASADAAHAENGGPALTFSRTAIANNSNI